MTDLLDVAIANQAAQPRWLTLTPAPARKRARRVKRPELPRTPQQLLAHAAADGIASAYGKAKVFIGVEQATVKIPGRGVFFVQVYRGSDDDWDDSQ